MTKIVKKTFKTIGFFSKAVILLMLLVSAWSLLGLVRIFRGDWGDNENGFRSVLTKLRINKASADVPSSTGGSTGMSSTPFLSYFDGKQYKLENDILYGKPTSYHSNYLTAKLLYENGQVRPDLYKIVTKLTTIAGKLRFQLQEIEPEESFFKWVKLKRIVHPKESVVMVDSEYKKFYVLDKTLFNERVIVPSMTKDENGNPIVTNITKKEYLWNLSGDEMALRKNQTVQFSFIGLKPGEAPSLIVKAWYRDWMANTVEESQRITQPVPTFKDLFRIAFNPTVISSFIAISIAASKLSGIGFLSYLPLLMGVCADSGATSATESSGVESHSLFYEYKNPITGEFKHVAISEPRAWCYNTEVVEFPTDAVSKKGEIELRVRASKFHILGFIGMAQNLLKLSNDKNYKEEILPLSRAYHNRLEQSMISCLNSEDKQYVHLIPGDTVDLEFSTNKNELGENQSETYLFYASGFYTALRKSSRVLAGNWWDKISSEAKERLSTLMPLT